MANQSRQNEFANELTKVVGSFADVPRGTRGAYLMTAIAALMAAEAGRIPTAVEFRDMMLVMARKLAADGMLDLG